MISYDQRLTTPKALAEVVEGLGYKVVRVTDEWTRTKTEPKKEYRAPVPDDAPAFFRQAFSVAREKKQPLIIDFWASWCAPCKRLKKETLGDEQVAKLLKNVQLLLVDLDEHPELGEVYEVDSVPDVFLIDRDGLVVDRLGNFEPPVVFARRVQRLLGGAREGKGLQKGKQRQP